MPTPTDATDSLYDDEFYDRISGWARPSARVVIPLIREIVRPASVVDVGCGVGTWLTVWQEEGVDDVFGLDGDHVGSGQLQIDPRNFRAADLDRPPALDRTFDLAMSLEVAEHLAPTSAPAFVTFLTSLAPVVLFSAAVPGQGGVGHVNEQWPAYWSALFAACGFQPADIVRPLVWNHPDVAFFYAQNLLLFACDDRLAGVTPALPLVGTGTESGGGPGLVPLPLVHPGFSNALLLDAARPAPATSFPDLARQLPGAGMRALRRRAGAVTSGRRR